MARPDRSAGRKRRRLVGAMMLLLLAGCGSGRPGAGDGVSGPPTWPEAAATTVVEAQGRLRGPVAALGPSVELRVWVFGDGALRAELRRHPEGAPPVHEVLLWTEDAALLFDRRTGRFIDLGEEPGRLEAFGGSFDLADALWLLRASLPTALDADVRWTRRSGDWRGRHGPNGLRRPVRAPAAWSELVWRDGERRVHRLQSRLSRPQDTALGSWARRLEVEGSDLDGLVVLEWERVETSVAGADSVLDPLWEPVAP